ncbi:autotransporter outer membrane beta-barrel domain-containing protein [Bordetella genomosp. 5]|uniref:Autotransporter domain-containing protein n=1 Tax=Bordetella genomosp. 5 TaxID=1395608 RepID=A0A261U1X1_9BORD|nr:autotransporter outer membrane beta-barrel domain-containing protein [Bordetella genomosp. 5]OZI55230.1 hypothetical protein CAL25_02095 [Bordetella genomosp. 5]
MQTPSKLPKRVARRQRKVTSRPSHGPAALSLNHARTLFLLAWCSTWPVAQAQQNLSCGPQNGGLVCSNDGGQSLSSPVVLNQNNDNLIVTNNADLVLAPNSSATGVQVISDGATGTPSSVNGGAGHPVTLTNNGSVTVTLTGSGGQMGIGVRASSRGGIGATPSDLDTGGVGGYSMPVTLTNNAAVSMFQDASADYSTGVMGVYAESAGGNGAASNSDVIDYYGGNGGAAAEITLDNYAGVTIGSSTTRVTGSTRAWGVAAESFGGMGGEYAKGQLASDAAGEGGNGGNVTVNSQGNVGVYWQNLSTDTTPDGVVGIMARSVGGSGGLSNFSDDAGGNGGNAGTVTINLGPTQGTPSTNPTSVVIDSAETPTGTSAAVLGLSRGGVGGAQDSHGAGGGLGGNAGAVTIQLNHTTVQSNGANVAGVIALSRGADGGSGDASHHATNGGNGGMGGAVSISLDYAGSPPDQASSVSTNGTNAYGLLAQSVGGYGGIGTTQGGIGQNAGTAFATTLNYSSVTTIGDYAAGIVTQSIGGGGGTGTDFTIGLAGAGGNGGNGGSGNNSTISTSGQITTTGQHAYGLLAQSIGGSGGTGGVGEGLIVALGGDGGAGGAGGTANVDNAGAVTTNGYGAIGMAGQSIGGGGGAAGSSTGLFAVGGSGASAQSNNGGTVYVTNTGSVVTQGAAAIALLGQSIGGGGGNAASAAGLLAIGGSGGAAGIGGAVTVSANGTQRTTGNYAYGAVAQSIGGGGGNGGDALVLTTATATPAIGGSGGAAGDGGNVLLVVNNDGTLTTWGDGATAALAQSIGGGGGSGGNANNVAIVDPVSLSIGGAARGGGNAGTVTVNTSGASLQTNGASASGIVAQSIGGGGGSGGTATAMDVNVGFSLGVAVGGSGGEGGTADKVAVTLADTQINTGGLVAGQAAPAAGGVVTQTDSIGILAQSIGGGGGAGGSVASRGLALPIPVDEDMTLAISSTVAVGGTGGSGGNGAEADTTLSGTSLVRTNGQGSHGVVAQSIGGGGGHGGDSKAMGRTLSLPGASLAVNVDVSVGGNGGVSGSAALVNLQMLDQAQIATYGDFSNALMGQSVGGGGGNAGVGSSGSGGRANGNKINVSVGVGGKGYAGGSGGAAQAGLAQNTALATYGAGSRGVLLQSVGGGGGASQGTTVDVGGSYSGGGGDDDADADATPGFAAEVSVSVGGNGGTGGSGGVVQLTHAGTINTTGNDSDGVLLQSIGGGGGLGGSASSDASSGPSSSSSSSDDPDDADVASSDDPGDDPDGNNVGTYTLSVAVGGKGGGGGNGGTVTVNHTGYITTQGDLADGLIVQSIGGGGGVGGTSTAKGAQGDLDLSIAVGGAGGTGGNGGEINLNMLGQASAANPQVLTAQVITKGNVSYGVLAQSIGGGGGQAADGSGNVTYQTGSTPSLVIGVGGKGGAGGLGGTVNLNAPNSLFGAATSGTGSHAVVLQSIGGGGGAASANASNSASLVNEAFVLNLGGGGSGRDSGGGAINIDTALRVYTSGDGAYGLVAQSIGGGGGIAYAGQAANIASATIDTSQQSNAYDASGGTINVTLNTVAPGTSGLPPYDIRTQGTAAYGIVLQSIGGGGGIAGDPGAPLQMGWQGGGQTSPSPNRASGGDITLDMGNTQLYVNGANSIGVVMQSIADGGGLGGTAQGSFAGSVFDHASGRGGKAGSITFTQDVDGRVLSYGPDPVGVVAQSDGNTAMASPISLNIGGLLQTTTDDPNGVGLWLDGGSDANVVTVSNTGKILSTTAVQQTRFGTTTVNNAGQVSGTLLLTAQGAATVGAINNTGTLLNAQTVRGSVFNDGNVLIGSAARIDSMRVTNDYTQRGAGTLHVSADFSGRRADTLTVDGAASLGGHVRIDAVTLMPNRELPFLQAGTLTSGASVGGASSLFSFNTRYTEQTAAVSAGQANFQAVSDLHGVGNNLREVSEHLQNIWDRGSNEALGSLYAQLDHAASAGRSGYASALSDLSPGLSAAPAALATGAMKSFADALFSCPWFDGANARTAEGDCVWGRVSDKTTHLDAGRGTAATRARTTAYQLGAQRRIAPNWVFGVSAAYEHSNVRADDSRVQTKGDAGYVGAVLKYDTGPWTFSGATYGSFGSYDNTRRIALTNAQAKSSSDVWSIGQQLRAAYTHATDTAYIKPYTNLDLIYTRMPSYSERGAGPLNLDVKSADKFTALLTPGVEVGARFDMKNGYTARPFVNVGVSLASTDNWTTKAQLAAAPGGSGDFRTTLETGRVFGHATVGVELASKAGFDLRLQYDGLLSDRARSSGGSVKATWRF